MRVALRFLLAAVVLFPLTAGATIINIPGDYPTIQEGIDHSSDGDTVLVQPDIYYENINFNGHNVVLASLFLTTGDTIYVLNTVIDGDRAGSVITFESGEDSTTQVIGFTIRNGKGGGSYPYFRGGGITCWDNSRPTISWNVICENWGLWHGGGIYYYNSSPTIDHNTICDNFVSEEGGGICCFSRTSTITNNAILRNEAYSGGGIYGSGDSSSVIVNNIISDNVAITLGGGICCRAGSSPTVEGNLIKGNFAWWLGGGMYFSDSDPVLSNNAIVSNTVIGEGPFAGDGGGIYCWKCDAAIINNSISGNRAQEYGGGIYCVESSPVIINTIFWNNAAVLEGKEIYLDSLCFPTVTYCDIEDTLWPGVGNISADPVFCGQHNEDFYLRWRSPCIDAGDPDPSYNDPDGTRNDMGCFYFNQAVLGIVEVYPHDEPIVIPPEGGDVTYDGGILNLSGGDLTVDIYAYVFVPRLSERKRVWRHDDVTIPAGDSIIRADLMEHVPDFAPAGDYVFVTYIGDYPSSIIDSCCFYLSKEKAGLTSKGTDNWQTLKGWFDEDLASRGSRLPTDYGLGQNYPNPFNATTLINYQLASASYVKLEVYNLVGRKVATLVDEAQEVGYKSVNWDASKVSSGLYFYKLTTGVYTETKRMMLIK